MAVATVTVSYWIRQNAYGGGCAICGEDVAARAGWCQKQRGGGKWETLCNACVWEHARFVPALTESGQNLHGSSVVAGSGSHPIGCCRGCGKVVGLVKGRSGRWYFANVFPKLSGNGHRVYDFDAHVCAGRGEGDGERG